MEERQALTHINAAGEAHMVDIGEKSATVREAVAQALVLMQPETARLVQEGSRKGDVLACARIAGIMAAKQTSSLIPLCHPLPLEQVSIDFTWKDATTLCICATARCHYHTGVEMEAMTAASVAALTVYDMCKAADRGMVIQNVLLLKKSGGKSGVYERR